MADIRVAILADVESVYELLAARSRAAVGVSEVSREHVEDDFRGLGADRWVAEEGGLVVGYAHLTSTREAVHAALEPAIGDRLAGELERHARERGFQRIEITVVEGDLPLVELVHRRGFTHERDVLRMWRHLGDDRPPEPEWPTGLNVRTYGDGDGARVHALLDDAYAAWDTSYVAQPYDEWLAFMTDHREFDPALWFLVERDDDLVACALHWREHQARGWVKDLVVRADERGRGLGKALLHHGFRAYAERGAESVGLKVESTNPTGALQLYERVGFVVDRRYGVWSKEL